jgi:hypothetical protein
VASVQELARRAAPAPITPSGLLAGKKFVLTGTLPNMKRDDAKQRIESAGGARDWIGFEKDGLRGGRVGGGLEGQKGRRAKYSVAK